MSKKGGTYLTSANVFNLGSVGQGQKLNANAATSKTKVENSGAAAAFSSIMNGNYSTNLRWQTIVLPTG